jgi:hypothetical protein
MERIKLTKAVALWAEKIGHDQAKKRLVLRDVNVTTADKLCEGRYQSEPRRKLAKILREEMAKDGFTLAA